MFIKSLFNNFEDVYGDDYETVSINLKAIKKEPVIKMTDHSISMSADVKLSIMNPLNTNIEAAYINFFANFSFDVTLNENFIIKGDTKQVDLQITDLKTLFQADETVEDIK